MKIFKITSITLVAAVLLSSCAQRYAMKGDEAYEKFAYADAINNYEKIKDYKRDFETTIRLADSYHFNNQPAEAKYWYNQALIGVPTSDVRDEILLNYAQTLEATQEYDKAEKYYSAYFLRNPEDEAALSRLIAIELNEDGMFKDHRIEVTEIPVNRERKSTMSPTYYGNGLVFTSERDKSGDNNISPWTGRPFAEMYYADIKNDGTLSTPVVFAKNLQSPYDDGVVSFSPDEKTIYFTRTNYKDGELGMDDKNVVNLQIFRAELQANGEWSEPIRLSINSDHYSCFHPTVSADGKRLYFASDHSNSIGGSDIYFATINDDGTVSNPKNLGYMVNTERNEAFPVVSEQDGHDVLHFASAGHTGIGGYDIFRSTSYGNNWTPAQALPAPINSPRDDFGFISNDDMSEGYFTSTRGSDNGIDAIYHFTKTNEVTLAVTVLNEENGDTLKNADVALLDDEELKAETTTKSGEVYFNLEPAEAYRVTAEKDGFETESMQLSTGTELYNDTVNRVLMLEPEFDALSVDFAPIYFDFDQSNIRKSEQKDLEKVAAFLKENPEVNVKLIGHTDPRGSDAYNDVLAEERAKSTRAYLISKGIDAERIAIDSYGEDYLIYACDEPQVDCTESQYEMNRRTVIVVVEDKDFDNTTSDLK